MTVSICRSCRYEQSDCKGVKSIDTVRCDFFKERLATNYPARIRELEGKVEFFESLYQGQRDVNEKLLLRADRLEAENKELKFENNKLRQWTLNDRKVRHGFELAIETLNKCKEV